MHHTVDGQALPPARHRELGAALDEPVEAVEACGGLMTDARVRTQGEQAGDAATAPTMSGAPAAAYTPEPIRTKISAADELVELRACDVVLAELSGGDAGRVATQPSRAIGGSAASRSVTSDCGHRPRGDRKPLCVEVLRVRRGGPRHKRSGWGGPGRSGVGGVGAFAHQGVLDDGDEGALDV